MQIWRGIMLKENRKKLEELIETHIIEKIRLNSDGKIMELEAIDKELINLRAGRFIRHIEEHLKEGQEVICKICGLSADEIMNPEKTGRF